MKILNKISQLTAGTAGGRLSASIMMRGWRSLHGRGKKRLTPLGPPLQMALKGCFCLAIAAALAFPAYNTAISAGLEREEKTESLMEGAARGAQPRLQNIAAKKTRQVFYIPKHWTDAASGFAIGGIDPIAYFEESRMQWGEEEFEHTWRGTAWRFKTQGNLNAFRRSPTLYAPVFAGYDPYALANGILTEGKPALWAILEGRLYLFQNAVNRHLWSEEGEKLKAKVKANWQELSTDIPRYKLVIAE